MNKYNEYIKIINKMEDDNMSIIKLDIISNLKDFEDFDDFLTDNEKMEFIDLIYNYYVSDDWYEYNLYNFIEVAFDNMEDIKKNNFDDTYFYNLMDKKLLG